jgi:hypothetical protein
MHRLTLRHHRRRASVAAAVILSLAIATMRAPASEHPGNVFVAGEDVRVPLPSTWKGWRAIDVDRKEVGSGNLANGAAMPGKLPVGYFEVLEKDGPGKVTAAVLAKVSPVDNTPIAIDVAASWFYSDPDQIRAACRLVKLAGVNWVRDRGSWPELEPERGKFAGETRYERAMKIQHEMGLKILQVNHIAPPWANSNPKRFPEDLRDVYAFYKGLAGRWKDLADAIEPWNEPDIVEFGGHTGCEIASFQKAAYLGLKAGNPDLTVNDTVFAIDRPETLEDFGGNEVYPYFDRYDLHHYHKLPDYPHMYSRHRAVSAGRPMWVTEFNLTIFWADEKTHEPTEEDLRIQGYRVGKVFAEAIHEGPDKLFYFILGHYVERNLQYGLVHNDFTPRPAYVAFAAVGRFLNGATPLGRVDFGDDKLKGYLFKTTVDGAARETLVAWSETKPTGVNVWPAEAMYDYLGRAVAHWNGGNIELGRPTLFILLPPGGSKHLKVVPPPANAKWIEGNPAPVVLQLVGKSDFKKSSFVFDGNVNKPNELRLIAYNFGHKPARGTLQVEGGACARSEIEIAPGAREERTVKPSGPGTLTIRLDAGDVGKSVVSARLTKE